MPGLRADAFALLTGAAVPICLVVAYYVWGRRPRARIDRWVEVTVSDDGPGIPEQETGVLRHGSGLGPWVVD